jgi:hypothetical protein
VIIVVLHKLHDITGEILLSFIFWFFPKVILH